MPVYFAEGQAIREEYELNAHIDLFESMINELTTRYPYLVIEARAYVNPQAAEEHFKKKYTYHSNLIYDETGDMD